MNTENYFSNEEDNQNEIRLEDNKLALNQFVLNEEKNKNCQELFHEVLKTLINKYNALNEEQRKEEGIFYLEHHHILLGNIKEEVVQTYYEYKKLFNGLMSGKSMFSKNLNQNLIIMILIILINLFQKIITYIIEGKIIIKIIQIIKIIKIIQIIKLKVIIKIMEILQIIRKEKNVQRLKPYLIFYLDIIENVSTILVI